MITPLPKKYAVGQNIARLARVRPEAAAIGLALDQDAATAGISNPLSKGPDKNPSILKRIAIKKNVPKLKNNFAKFLKIKKR